MFAATYLFMEAVMTGSEIIVYMTIISLMIIGVALIVDNRPSS
jgi:hypothetical protein